MTIFLSQWRIQNIHLVCVCVCVCVCRKIQMGKSQAPGPPLDSPMYKWVPSQVDPPHEGSIHGATSRSHNHTTTTANTSTTATSTVTVVVTTTTRIT